MSGRGLSVRLGSKLVICLMMMGGRATSPTRRALAFIALAALAALHMTVADTVNDLRFSEASMDEVSEGKQIVVPIRHIPSSLGYHKHKLYSFMEIHGESVDDLSLDSEESLYGSDLYPGQMMRPYSDGSIWDGLQLNGIQAINRAVEMMEKQLREESEALSQSTQSLRWGLGVHAVEVQFGDSLETKLLIADSGSDLMALTCAHLCQPGKCGSHHLHQPFDINKSRTAAVSCQENDMVGLRKCNQCSDFSVMDKAGNDMQGDFCIFGAHYVEGSYWDAVKVKDSVSFNSIASPTYFGCIFEEVGEFQRQTADGILGMSQARDTLYHQFFANGKIERDGFSICLNGEMGGSMVLGGMRKDWNLGNVKKIKVRTDTPYKYWTITVVSISMGGEHLTSTTECFNKNKGTIIDSGTTHMFLPSEVAKPFEERLVAVAPQLRRYSDVSQRPFPCAGVNVATLPDIILVVEGQMGPVEIRIPSQKYLKESEGYCHYAIFFQQWLHGSILGQSFMDGLNIFFDRSQSIIEIAEANCPAALQLPAASREVMAAAPQRATENRHERRPLYTFFSGTPTLSFSSVLDAARDLLSIGNKEEHTTAEYSSSPSYTSSFASLVADATRRLFSALQDISGEAEKAHFAAEVPLSQMFFASRTKASSQQWSINKQELRSELSLGPMSSSFTSSFPEFEEAAAYNTHAHFSSPRSSFSSYHSSTSGSSKVAAYLYTHLAVAALLLCAAVVAMLVMREERRRRRLTRGYVGEIVRAEAELELYYDTTLVDEE